MTTVRHLLQGKSKQVYSVCSTNTVLDALDKMAEHDIGAVLVVDGDKLSGIYSERDYARQVAQTHQLTLENPVEVFMTRVVYGVKPDQTLEECMELMTEQHIRHLPVLDGERLVGVISIGDVVRELIVDREATITGLENYIVGRETVS